MKYMSRHHQILSAIDQPFRLSSQKHDSRARIQRIFMGASQQKGKKRTIIIVAGAERLCRDESNFPLIFLQKKVEFRYKDVNLSYAIHCIEAKKSIHNPFRFKDCTIWERKVSKL